MSPRTIIITGASDGIGAAAARSLGDAARHPHDTVVLVGRSPQKTAAIAAELGAEYFVADFSRLDEVRELGTTLRDRYPTIDILANNAGGIMGARELTVDGFEKTLQVNHLAPFLLTSILTDTLAASGATVINTASVAARLFGDIDISDLNLEQKYSPNHAYGNAKLANILFTRELHRRTHARGISTAAFHPGTVATSFASDTTSLMRFIYHTPFGKLLLTSPEKGADTLVWLAESAPGTQWKSGAFYEKRKVSATNPQADDEVLASQLWELSADMVGVQV